MISLLLHLRLDLKVASTKETSFVDKPLLASFELNHGAKVAKLEPIKALSIPTKSTQGLGLTHIVLLKGPESESS